METERKVSLSEARAMLQSTQVELSADLTLKLHVSLDNIDESTPTPKPTLSMLLKFLDAKDLKKEYGVLVDDDRDTNLHTVEDVSEAFNISLDTPIWVLRTFSEEE